MKIMRKFQIMEFIGVGIITEMIASSLYILRKMLRTHRQYLMVIKSHSDSGSTGQILDIDYTL